MIPACATAGTNAEAASAAVMMSPFMCPPFGRVPAATNGRHSWVPGAEFLLADGLAVTEGYRSNERAACGIARADSLRCPTGNNARRAPGSSRTPPPAARRPASGERAAAVLGDL